MKPLSLLEVPVNPQDVLILRTLMQDGRLVSGRIWGNKGALKDTEENTIGVFESALAPEGA